MATMTDALVAHCQATRTVRWRHPPAGLHRRSLALKPASVTLGEDDPHVRYIRQHDARRGSRRSGRMLDALAAVRRVAQRGDRLSWSVLRTVQALVLDRRVDAITFRGRPAFAKGGRERYGFAPCLPGIFATKLARDDGDRRVHPVAQAVRVYLDVCFFHPFDDGNARAARLALDLVLSRAGLLPANVAPIFLLPRVAGDERGYLDLLRLVICTIEQRNNPRVIG